MNYCYTDDWGCPYYDVETGACLLEDPELECDDYASYVEDEDDFIDTFSDIPPQPPLGG